ncbi:2,3-bisphosphoglycerate-dependent phosphoglycerate mutase [Orientia tsutsugamushi]|uniref:2,3-bisphosphoglycerate-dependent phosphoglycerate mutase n=1 Tax=Orientia tsutsugamushi TaxID=784 RepID=A0A2U3QN21_ORITS|nr:histidine phosphatase super family protein [Orientia tsutsugamushi str. UT76]SPR02339.1 2,3-bisphosphoglycerate-dependent phosphoglycerate mutase [Orientia tsutsugamushi]
MKGLPLKPFYFLRHGETDWNLAHRAMGSQDIPLNDRGVSQGLNAAELLKNEPIKRPLLAHLCLLRASQDCRYHCPAHKGSCHRNH